MYLSYFAFKNHFYFNKIIVTFYWIHHIYGSKERVRDTHKQKQNKKTTKKKRIETTREEKFKTKIPIFYCNILLVCVSSL
jgi:Mg2+/citrate symporter